LILLAEAEKGVSWEEWVLRSPCDSDEEDLDPADPDRASNWHSQDLCEIASYEEMGYLVVDRTHEDPVRHRYLQKHVHAAVFESMCQWDRDRSKTPAPVGDAGMLWLQRLLVDRDSVRRRYFDAPDYGPSGLGGVMEALGVVLYHCGPDVNGTTKFIAGDVFIILYTRALRELYRIDREDV
jgi:hypothetical protein